MFNKRKKTKKSNLENFGMLMAFKSGYLIPDYDSKDSGKKKSQKIQRYK